MRVKKKPNFSQLNRKIDPPINPFVADEAFKIKINVMRSSYSVNKDTGRPHEFELEATPYTKVFREAKYRTVTMKLSSGARQLKDWIFYEVVKSKDYVWIDRVRYMNESSITSLNTVLGAIKELRDKGFISPTTIQQVYWINSAIFFCGSRVNKYQSQYPNKIER